MKVLRSIGRILLSGLLSAGFVAVLLRLILAADMTWLSPLLMPGAVPGFAVAFLLPKKWLEREGSIPGPVVGHGLILTVIADWMIYAAVFYVLLMLFGIFRHRSQEPPPAPESELEGPEVPVAPPVKVPGGLHIRPRRRV